MHVIGALLGMLGILLLALLLSIPVGWAIDHTIMPALNYLQRKRIEWDAAYRD